MENEKWETTLDQAQIIAAIKNHVSTDPLVVIQDVTLGITSKRRKFFAEVKGVKVPGAQDPDLPRPETYTGHSTGV